jgi:hypothetical protein
MVGCGLVIAMPTCCAVYPQYSSISISDLEEEVKSKVNPKYKHLLYNKGI